ncbi:Txe/YoeB family addiction module toxin [Mucilaginibacter corticis]|uniref:Putative mRNA interferase YoeB n=1 Tax=Mucilaginibacter corticis TaxID=2597670 RepID=A0A556MXE2_9SPHI|nr:Txe/YoeB family addiction module toxin [Mucilaginibacter corticis]TSJ44562.1 Txe/YoeB family addiction module toxin [Mucilaginibacter corticis]
MGEFKVIVSENAKKDLSAIEKSGDKSSIKKVERIISELYIHPETGIGKPEKLKFELAGYWSRRINKKDRLVYLIENNIITVTIVSAIGHYGDK